MLDVEAEFIGSLKALLVRYNVKIVEYDFDGVRFVSPKGISLDLEVIVEALTDNQ